MSTEQRDHEHENESVKLLLTTRVRELKNLHYWAGRSQGQVPGGYSSEDYLDKIDDEIKFLTSVVHKIENR